jgi:hypothetical protein
MGFFGGDSEDFLQRSLAATKRPKEAPRGLVSRRTTARQKNKLRAS